MEEIELPEKTLTPQEKERFYKRHIPLTEDQKDFIRKSDIAIMQSLAKIDATLKRTMVGWSDVMQRRFTRLRLAVFTRNIKEMVNDTNDLLKYLEVVRRESNKCIDTSAAIARLLGYTKYKLKETDTTQRRGRKPKPKMLQSVIDAFGVSSPEELAKLAEKVRKEAEILKKEQLRIMRQAEKSAQQTENQTQEQNDEFANEND